MHLRPGCRNFFPRGGAQSHVNVNLDTYLMIMIENDIGTVDGAIPMSYRHIF